MSSFCLIYCITLYCIVSHYACRVAMDMAALATITDTADMATEDPYYGNGYGYGGYGKKW